MGRRLEVNFIREHKRKVIAISTPALIGCLVLAGHLLFGQGNIFTNPEPAFAASISWDGGAGTSDWEDAANWSTDTVPTDVDDVTIDDNVTVDINGTTTINSLTLGNAGGTTSPTLNFDYDAFSSGALIIDDGNLIVNTSATITHTAGTSVINGRISIDVQTGTADIDGSINASLKGYAADNGPGVGVCVGGACGGGGYGGEGGDGFFGAPGASGGGAYGCDGATCSEVNISFDVENPHSLGSGGGSEFGNGGAGGGVVVLDIAGTLTIDGSILTEGEAAAGTGESGGGAGGAINITADTVNGTGAISANGGNGDPCCGGGGGGGRIAIFYTNAGTFDLATPTAYGGARTSAEEANYGGAGTYVHKADAAANASIVIDNNDQDESFHDLRIGRTSLNYTVTFNDFTIQNAGNLDLDPSANITVNGAFMWSDSGRITDNGGTLATVSGTTLTVPSTARLYANTTRSYTSGTIDGDVTHSNNFNTETYKLNQTFSGALTISATGSINASERGYEREQGPGAGTCSGGVCGGGGYGGEGGDGFFNVASGLTRGDAYGCDGATCSEANIGFDVENPHSLGSGGGDEFNAGGQGGGSVTLQVGGTLTLGGPVSADGEAAVGAGEPAGGSGGSIKITADTVDGLASVSADGGAGDGCCGGGGGGGRIAIFYTTAGTFDLDTPTVYGGASSIATEFNAGGAGTYIRKADAEANSTLIIDNNDQAEMDNDLRVGRTPINYALTLNDLIIRNAGNLELDPSANITVNGTFDWSDSGFVTDFGGTFAPISGSTLAVPATARLYANTTRTYATGSVGGMVTHSNNFDTETYKLNQTFTDTLSVAVGGAIDVAERGYERARGPGAGNCTGFICGGGGYGGEGGDGGAFIASGSSRGSAYGCDGATCDESNISFDVENPHSIGSGGGTEFNGGGSGGGSISLSVTNTLTVDGTVTASGETAAGLGESGGGSGGSINVTAGTIHGSGSVSANGGGGDACCGGGGGGGRIAIFYTNAGTFDLDSPTAYGGASTIATEFNAGGAGTYIRKADAEANPTLVIDNNDQAENVNNDLHVGRTPINYSLTLNDFTIRNAGNLDLDPSANITVSGTFDWSDSGFITDFGGTFAPISGSTLTIPSTARLYGNTTRSYTSGTIDGTVTHSNNFNSETYKLNQTFSGGLSLSAGGAFDVNHRGYERALGPGAGACDGIICGGAGYGGEGGAGAGFGALDSGGSAYGCDGATCDESNISFDVENPHSIGSGGGSISGGGGSGAGSVTLNVGGTFSLDGTIVANGESASGLGGASGGGSGGGIKITADTVNGSGSVNARGGSGTGTSGGGGGGGRIAIFYTTAGTFDLDSPKAYGGAATTARFYNAGGAGAYIHKADAEANSSLMIDNNDQAESQNFDIFVGRTPINSTISLNDFTIRNAGNLDLDPSANITVNGTFDWSDAGHITDFGGTLAPISGTTLTIPATARLYANTARSYSGGVTVNGLLTHTNNLTTETYKINLTTTSSSDFTVNSGGSIIVDEKGYIAGNGPGAGSVVSSFGSGAGYGGVGGDSSTGAPGGSTYGSEVAPENIGSGGGQVFVHAGVGGGAIKLTVDGDLSLGGPLSATGSPVAVLGTSSGGGSGGSIYLVVAGTLSGAGDLTADGGDGDNANTGAGGGGRIRYECNVNSWSGTPSAATGSVGIAGDAGTISSACLTNSDPLLSNVAASQVQDGSGHVSVSFDADDPDDNDTLEALIEYDVGAGFQKATMSEVDGDTSADFGDPAVENDDTYQVGNASGYILTSSGSNTVNTVWLAGTDEPGIDVANAVVRVTLFDGVSTSTTESSPSFNLDLDAPEPTAAEYLDTNTDALIDRVDVTFDQGVFLSSYDAADWAFPTPGTVNVNDTGASVSGAEVQLSVSADADTTGGATDPTVEYTNNAGRLTDDAGNPVATFSGPLTVSDAAAPLIYDHSPEDGETGVDQFEDVVVEFSEPMNVGTVNYTFSDPPTGISDSWSNSDRTLTVSHTGGFSSGSQTFEVTSGNAAAGSPSALAGAVAPAANPFTFNVTVPSSGTGFVSVTNNSIEISQGEVCSPTREVVVRLEASNANDYMLSEDPEFFGESWHPFEPNVEEGEPRFGPDDEPIHAMDVSWNFDSDGEKTLYARFRSRSQNVSSRVQDSITIDTIDQCEPVVIEPAPETGEEGPSPIDGEMEPISEARIGDWVMPESYDRLYYLGSDYTRHPIMNLLIFFTYEPSLSVVKLVTDATLPGWRMGKPLAPKEETVLLKFETSSVIFLVQRNDSEEFTPILRRIRDEEMAAEVFGEDWKDYIMELNSAYFTVFIQGPELTDGEFVDISKLMTREELEELAPDGSLREFVEE